MVGSKGASTRVGAVGLDTHCPVRIASGLHNQDDLPSRNRMLVAAFRPNIRMATKRGTRHIRISIPSRDVTGYRATRLLSKTG